ncbi:MAG TPA: FKBP-type peptidyl-prolyl cis-trans isomerase [Polyangiaceae bacterium]|jgi:peptidylprolyl isomerase
MVREALAVALAASLGLIGCREGTGGSGSGVDAAVIVAAAPAQDASPAIPPPPPRPFPPPPDVGAPPADARPVGTLGVLMKVLKPGTGTDRPKLDDCVKLSFTGWKRDGALLTTSKVHDDAAVHCLRRTMPGLAAALGQMVVGEAARVWIPGALTYKPREPGEAAPQVDLTFDVEILDLLRAPAAPEDLAAPPKTATKTPSGLAYRVLKAGTGTVHPSNTSRVRLRFSGWTADGALFASTASAPAPAEFSMGDVIPGWREGLPLMVAGEKMRFWVPPELGFGEKARRGGQPSGRLVYDVELVEVE